MNIVKYESKMYRTPVTIFVLPKVSYRDLKLKEADISKLTDGVDAMSML